MRCVNRGRPPTPRAVAPARVASVLVGARCLAGCAEDAPQDTWQPAGDNAQRSRTCSGRCSRIAGVVGLIVSGAIGCRCIRFRDHGQPMPKQTHGKPALEIALTILPALILVGVGIPTVGTFRAGEDRRHRVLREHHRPAVVVGDRLPGPGRLRRASPTPIVTSGQLVIPTETNV